MTPAKVTLTVLADRPALTKSVLTLVSSFSLVLRMLSALFTTLFPNAPCPANVAQATLEEATNFARKLVSTASFLKRSI